MATVVVDDDERVRQIVTERLEDLAFSVFEAKSGREARASIRHRGELDLVIGDVSMPEMDGLKRVEELNPMRESLPIIRMSGRSCPDHARLFRAKPLMRPAVCDSIAAATALSEGADERRDARPYPQV
jgi:CheY-like chemotaxis protein